jgi:hypothetical protein
MTALNENRIASAPAGAEYPVWQFELPPVEPLEAIEDSDTNERSRVDEPLIDEVGTTSAEAWKRLPPRPPARAQRAGSVPLLLAASALVALGGVSFAIGHLTSNGGSSTVQTAAFRASASGAPGFGAGASGAGVAGGTATISGTVVSATADSMTLQLANGQTVTIATDPSTTYHGQTSAASSAVTTGSTVIVQTSGIGSGSATVSSSAASASPGSTSATASAGPGTGAARTATSVTITSE